MSRPEQLRTRLDFLQAQGVLLVLRDPPTPAPAVAGQPAAVPGNPLEGKEILLALWDDGSVVALHGHVDLGTGIRTAFAQIVAEELDVPLERVQVILGDTGIAPNQGPTIASSSLQIHGAPLRAAAAQARHALLSLAQEYLQAARATLTIKDGVIKGPLGREASFAQLLVGKHLRLDLDLSSSVKTSDEYKVVGQSAARLDIPAKVQGELTFVHDMRLPGMLHGRVVRPPYAGADHGDFVGNSLQSVDEQSIAHIPGIRAVVVIRDFIGIVAEREEDAELAAKILKVNWKDWPGLPDLSNLEQALRDNPAKPRQLIDEGDVDAALAQADPSMPRTYVWPYQMHASIGPSCAVAHFRNNEVAEQDAREPFTLSVWAGTQNPHVLRFDLARLTGLTDTAIEIVRMEASGCYGRNGADDVAADAVLLSRAVGAPVRVQLTREQESLWEPKGAAQWMQVRGGLNAVGGMAGYDFTTSYPSNGSPTLALLLTRTLEPSAQTYEMGDRTARPPYTVENLRVTVNDMPPILRASWLRGVSALPNSFAHESYIDELATEAGADPLEFRLRHLDDPRARELLTETAKRAAWLPHTVPQQQASEGDILHGQGIAYARYIHSKWPGFGAAWAAWVADVAVNQRTGEVHVKRVVVGHDAGMTINPAGVQQQVHGNVLQTTSRALLESVPIEPVHNTVATRDWGTYPILNFRQVPVIEVVQMPRPNEPVLGAGESSSVPGTAAIANAIFDATGVRFRQPPFTPEVIRAALNPLTDQRGLGDLPAKLFEPERLAAKENTLAVKPRAKAWWLKVLGLSAAAVGTAFTLFGNPPRFAPVSTPDLGTYSQATLERGRQLAALGNCATCHTQANGKLNAGGRPIDTPFGVVYSTNITPDIQTGLGAWSLASFERALRQGISRDGRHLYPAFPYTSFARLSDDDVTALYAWLMAQEPVSQKANDTLLDFPFNQRGLMRFWNALYAPVSNTANNSTQPSAAQTVTPAAMLARGEYLVNGIGHCGACHTARDLLGGEKTGKAYLAGAMVGGWEAPALNAQNAGPVPWTEQAFYDYLRFGHSDLHGSASGPMAAVVRQYAALDDSEIRAMSMYLASLQSPVAGATDAKKSDVLVAQVAKSYVDGARANEGSLLGPAQRLFQNACASCHYDGQGPKLLGVNTPLALNSNLHSDRPDNVIRVILEGVRDPASAQIGFMQGFGEVFDDAQLVDLIAYMRQRFAPDKPAWQDLPERVKALR